jgi:hypothetical protein
MTNTRDLRTPRLAEIHPEMRFSTITATGLDAARFAERADRLAATVRDELREPRPEVAETVAGFAEYFSAHGHAFPLRQQIARAAKRGFPKAPAPVLALLAAEAGTGVLMGVQDADAVDGWPCLDVARGGEQFTGMRDAVLTCADLEVVVRDGSGIIASLLQGPDQRTALTPQTRSLEFYVFDTPDGLGKRHDAAVELLTGLVSGAAESTTVRRE